MGFIKFDLLGLSTLKMMEGAIYHILKRHHGVEEPTFAQIRDYYEEVFAPRYSRQMIKRYIATCFTPASGRVSSSSQSTEPSSSALKVKPNNIIDCFCDYLYLPSWSSVCGVDADYVEAKESPHYIKYPVRRGARDYRRDFWLPDFPGADCTVGSQAWRA